MEFKNTRELEGLFAQIIPDIVDNITTDMKYKMQDSIGKKHIGSCGSTYNSTGEFQEAWVNEKSEMISNDTCEGEMHYEPDLIMTHNPEEWQHSSQVEGWRGVNIDAYLPEIIFESGSYPLWGKNKSTVPRDAWDTFEKKADKSFSKQIRDNFKRHGVKILTNAQEKKLEENKKIDEAAEDYLNSYKDYLSNLK